MSFIYLAVEDALSEAVGRKLIAETLGPHLEVLVLRRGGFGYLKSRLSNLLEMAKRNVVLMITDLDKALGPPTMRTNWLKARKVPEGYVFRIAVREIEAWILADRSAIAELLDIDKKRVPSNVEELEDPKAALLELAKRAPRQLREEMLPRRGAVASQGLGYNEVLGGFVQTNWSCERAMENSSSLRRAYTRLNERSGDFS